MTLLFIGTTELLLIAGVALLIFGGKKVPELMKGLGKGVQSFKQGMNEPLDSSEPKPEEMVDEAQAEPKENNGAGQ
ncbi:MAG: twin-arginine translocase TatA/TatE family subunit [Bacteroidales bacterium]|nr:twin-arginine translocase TatA/TatE family subunit [Bacteroidales bacterium]